MRSVPNFEGGWTHATRILETYCLNGPIKHPSFPILATGHPVLDFIAFIYTRAIPTPKFPLIGNNTIWSNSLKGIQGSIHF